jgi:hypothetical protein
VQDTIGVAGGEVLGVHALAERQLPGERPLGPFGRDDLVVLTVVRGPFGPAATSRMRLAFRFSYGRSRPPTAASYGSAA